MSDYPTSVPDEQHVAEIQARTGVTEAEAWFVLALERGDIDGDLIPEPPVDCERGERS